MIDCALQAFDLSEDLFKWICMSKECQGFHIFLAPVLAEEPWILPICPECGSMAVDAYA